MKKQLIKYFRYRSYRKAVKEANRLRAKDFKKYLVIFLNGEFTAMSKQRIKELKKKGAFRKDLNVKQIESRAVYSTH